MAFIPGPHAPARDSDGPCRTLVTLPGRHGPLPCSLHGPHGPASRGPASPCACGLLPAHALRLRASTCIRGLRPLHPTTSGHVTWRLGSGPTGLRAGAPPHPGTRPAPLIHVHALRGSLPTARAPVLPDTGPAGFVARDLPPTQLWTCPRAPHRYQVMTKGVVDRWACLDGSCQGTGAGEPRARLRQAPRLEPPQATLASPSWPLSSRRRADGGAGPPQPPRCSP
jgi:hypothetical protein